MTVADALALRPGSAVLVVGTDPRDGRTTRARAEVVEVLTGGRPRLRIRYCDTGREADVGLMRVRRAP